MKQILFELGMFATDETRPASEAVLRKCLELLHTADLEWLKAHPETPKIYQARVRYVREPLGRELDKLLPPEVHAMLARFPMFKPWMMQTEIWKAIRYVMRDGFGDCEDLACWKAAELNMEGVPAFPDFSYRKVGRLSIYHIFVRLPGGRIEDPSKRLGMR